MTGLSPRLDQVRTQRDDTLSQAHIEANLIDPLSDPEWDRQTLSHPNATFFHSSAWAKVLSRTYGHEPVYVRLAKDGELLALVPIMEVRSRLTGRRGVCLPFTDVCEPLLFAHGTCDLVQDHLRDLARERKWKHFEIRGAVSEDSATPAVTFYTHSLDLSAGSERLFAGFDSAVRRAVRKGERSKLTVEVTRTKEAVLQFYQLHLRTRRRHGVPPQPLRFFVHIYEEVIKRGLGFVVLAYHNSQPVAGAVFFQFGNTAIYKFGASDESHLELRGNNLVMSQAIRYLAENHAKSLHFGRTSLSNDGLRRFKQSWGAKEKRHEYFRFDPVEGTWLASRDRSSGFHTALFSRMPLTLNRLAGLILYPHLD